MVRGGRSGDTAVCKYQWTDKGAIFPGSGGIPLPSVIFNFCQVFHSNPSVLAGETKLYIQTLLSGKDDAVKCYVLYSNDPIYQVCGSRLKSLL